MSNSLFKNNVTHKLFAKKPYLGCLQIDATH